VKAGFLEQAVDVRREDGGSTTELFGPLLENAVAFVRLGAAAEAQPEAVEAPGEGRVSGEAVSLETYSCLRQGRIGAPESL
jgi:hypothetical protein